MKKSIAFLIIFFAVFNGLNSQKSDSLLRIINSGAQNKSYVDACLQMAGTLLYSNTDSSFYYTNKLNNSNLDLSLEQQLKLNKVIGIAWVLLGNYDSAVIYMRKSLESGKKIFENLPNDTNHIITLAGLNANMATIYYYTADYESAIEFNFKALKLFEKVGFWRGVSVCESNLGNINFDMKNNSKAIYYHRKSLQSAIKTGDLYDLSLPYNNLGLYYLRDSIFDSAQFYLSKCININKNLNLETELLVNYQNYASLLFNNNMYDSALIYANKGLNLSIKLNNIQGKIGNYFQLAEIYFQTNIDTSISLLNKALQLSRESNMSAYEVSVLEKLITAHKKKHEYREALELSNELLELKDEIFNAEQDKNIAELETKYETEKNKAKISLLEQKSIFMQKQNRQNKILYLLIITILGLVVISIVFYLRTIRIKQKAEREKLQKEAERKLLETVIETEYKERRRFAEDLHDSLGVLLSTIKLYINELNTKRLKAERQDMVNQINKLLDDAIKNARQISNNIMPAIIKYNGFYSALKSFADKINFSGKLNIDINNNNFSQKLKPSFEISLYRILIEFINNTLKHANAKNVIINLGQKNNKLFVSYRDDGIGFDVDEVLKQSEKGLGLINSVNRIKTMGGKIELKSEKGFFAGIELKIDEKI